MKKRVTKNKISKIIFFLLSIFLMYKIITKNKSGLEDLASNISYPFFMVINKIAKPIEAVALRKKNYSQLLSDNIVLREENEKLLQENILLKGSINFDEKSKDILDFKARYNLDNVVESFGSCPIIIDVISALS